MSAGHYGVINVFYPQFKGAWNLKKLYNIIDMKSPVLKLILVLFFGIFIRNAGAMNSNNYRIDWDSLSSGGLDYSSSANYSMEDVLGQLVSGWSSSGHYSLTAGYRLPEIEPILLFDVKAQDLSTEVSVINGGFNDLGLMVKVSDASDYSINDYIGVVENRGQAQEVAVGQIAGIIGNVIYVDFWEGDNATMETIDGIDDYVYKMSSNSVSLGVMSLTKVNTGISFIQVTTNAENGYLVQISEDHNLAVAFGSQDIDDVFDGVVSAGSEEYGIESIGQDTQGTGDWAITEDAQIFATDSSWVTKRRTITSYKVAIDEKTAAGRFSHTVTYTCTGIF